MADFNPNRPNALGLEWWPTAELTAPVDAGPAWVQRLPSTGAETVTGVGIAARGTPGQNGILHTLIEVIPEGDEQPGAVQTVDIFPSADGDIGSWTRNNMSTTDLYLALQDPFVWPNLPWEPYIRTTAGFNAANFHLATDAVFGSGGPLQNARICRVQLGAIIATFTDPPTFLQIGLGLVHDGTQFPANSAVRDAHPFGELHLINYGELNPVTALPWTPADLADFDVGGDWRIQCNSVFVFNGVPAVITLGLRVSYIEVENRAAVGSWRRSGPPPDVLFDLTTDDFVSLPDGTPGWAKPATGNFLYVWRQARSPILHTGTTLSKDTRWPRSYQTLGPAGNPPGLEYPPSDLRGNLVTFDDFGLATGPFLVSPRSAAPIVPLTAGGPSQDGQPYRLTLADLTPINAGQKVGQAVTPAVSASYAGVRSVVFPPASGAGSLTASVHQVGGSQVGGTVVWTADEVRAIPQILTSSTARPIEGFFPAPIALTNGVQYEIRLSAVGSWLAHMPSATIGPEVSFGGTTDGAFIGAAMDPDRDLEIALTIAPAEPEAVTAVVVTEPVNNWACVTEVQHVRLSWTPGTPPLGAGFVRYDIDRRIRRPEDPDFSEGEGWVPVATIAEEDAEAWVNRAVPRGWIAQYRIRSVGAGGAASLWVETGTATPEAVGCTVIFTSDQCPELEVVYERLPEVDYDFLDHQADVVLPIYGADYQVAFFEPEDRGVAADFDVFVNFRDLPTDRLGNVIGGKAVFEPLRRITRSTKIPYVVVMDHQGNVWRGHVTLSNGRNQEPGNRYTVHVTVVPVTDTPAPVDLPLEP